MIPLLSYVIDVDTIDKHGKEVLQQTFLQMFEWPCADSLFSEWETIQLLDAVVQRISSKTSISANGSQAVLHPLCSR